MLRAIILSRGFLGSLLSFLNLLFKALIKSTLWFKNVGVYVCDNAV
jgi:hypothetical protein